MYINVSYAVEPGVHGSAPFTKLHVWPFMVFKKTKSSGNWELLSGTLYMEAKFTPVSEIRLNNFACFEGTKKPSIPDDFSHNLFQI